MMLDERVCWYKCQVGKCNIIQQVFDRKQNCGAMHFTITFYLSIFVKRWVQLCADIQAPGYETRRPDTVTEQLTAIRMEMLLAFITINLLHCTYIEPYITEEYCITSHPSLSGVGEALKKVNATSIASCGQECISKARCSAANYSPKNKTCTLLHVVDVMDDWEKKDDDVTYICVDCEAGPEGLFV